MSVFKCPTCGKKHPSRSKLRDCVIQHLKEETHKDEESTIGYNVISKALEETLEDEESIEEGSDEEESEDSEEESPVLYFRKKPVIVQAQQTKKRIKIDTPEGVMTARPGDWIITGVAGEQYPCDADIFARTYSQCDGPNDGAVVIPYNLCPSEVKYLGTNLTFNLVVTGYLTEGKDFVIQGVNLVRR